MVGRSVFKDVQPGDIILLHDIYPSPWRHGISDRGRALEAEGIGLLRWKSFWS